jgi:NAD-dependent deacetylase
MAMQDDIAAAARRLAPATSVVVLTGAGVSRESGIPTFRDVQTGLWARYDPAQLATRGGFLRDPQLVWAWYDYRRRMVEAAEPNAGHHAIVTLARLLPAVTVVTQNVDGLHQAAGSLRVLELHGSLRRFKCLGGGHDGFTAADFAGQAETPPHCPACGDLLRPDVVWFGEMLPEEVLAEATALCGACDLLLVVGTSGVVYPAAGLPGLARRAGAYVIDVNPQRDEIAGDADLFLQGPGGEVLPALAEAVRRTLG